MKIYKPKQSKILYASQEEANDRVSSPEKIKDVFIDISSTILKDNGVGYMETSPACHISLTKKEAAKLGLKLLKWSIE